MQKYINDAEITSLTITNTEIIAEIATESLNLTESSNNLMSNNFMKMSKNITYINIQANCDFSFLRDCKKLQTLNISGHKIKPEYYQSLAKLQKINLQSCLLQNSDLPDFANFPNLRELKLSINCITEIPQNLSANLEYLNISCNKITQIQNVEKLVNLRYLDLCNNNISEIKNCENLQKLENLNLIGNPLNFGRIYSIHNLSNLILQYGKLSTSYNDSAYLTNLAKQISTHNCTL